MSLSFKPGSFKSQSFKPLSLQHTVLQEPPTNVSPTLTAIAQMDWANVLFLFAALIVPLEIKLVASFTLYDGLIVALAALILIGPHKLKNAPAPFAICGTVFLLFALLSTFRALYPIEALTQIAQFAFIFFVQIPVILTLISSWQMARLTIFFYLIGALIAAGWALVNQDVQGAGRVMTFFSDNPNRLGYPSAYLMPYMLYFLFYSWRRWGSLLMTGAIAPAFYVLIWALAASASRSATVGLLAAVMIFLIFRHGFELNLKLPLRIVSTALVIFAVGYLLYQADYFPSTLRERIDRTLAFETNLVDDRRRLAEAGLNAFYESPWVGVGLDNFRYVAKDYLPAATNQLPHNLWIQFLAQVGLVGTVAFFGLIAFWFMQLFQAQAVGQESRRVSDERLEFLWAFIASMLAVMTIYLFLPIMIHRHYWLLYGVGLSLAQNVHDARVPYLSTTADLAFGASPVGRE